MFSDKDEDNGLFPKNLLEIINKFDKLIIWKKVPGTTDTEFPEPQTGIDETFDMANK